MRGELSERRGGERMDQLLGEVRGRAWPGPDHGDRVEAFLSERVMRNANGGMFGRASLVLALGAFVGGGAVAAAVTHQIMSQRARITTDDGRSYDVELLPTPEGAGGTFVAEDGTVYGINMTEQGGGQRSVTVDMDAVQGGTSTVTVDGVASPSMRLAPGQSGSISVEPARRAVFTDESGVQHEVDPSAVEGWTGEGASDE